MSIQNPAAIRSTPLIRAPCMPSGAGFSNATNAVSAAITVKFITPPAKQQQHQRPAATHAVGALGGHFKSGHLWTVQNQPICAWRPRRGLRFSCYSRQGVAARYPEITFGPAPGAAHRCATRIRALKMDDATAKRNLITARIFVMEPPAGRNRPTAHRFFAAFRLPLRLKVYLTPSPDCKSVWTFVRQLPGPHLPFTK
jgi:hypothetical protein